MHLDVTCQCWGPAWRSNVVPIRLQLVHWPANDMMQLEARGEAKQKHNGQGEARHGSKQKQNGANKIHIPEPSKHFEQIPYLTENNGTQTHRH